MHDVQIRGEISGTRAGADVAAAQAVPIEAVRADAFRVPTEQPESDGTHAWDATTMLVVELDGGGATGIGYAYTHAAAAPLVRGALADVARGRDAMATAGLWEALRARCRNLGRPGFASSAIAAVDVAAWDLKGKLLHVALADLLGRCRDEVPVYGSGGFTSYDVRTLQRQLAGWVEQGIGRVKMKVGREPAADPSRVRAARDAIGDGAELFVDANGAWDGKQAVALAERFHGEAHVRWFEEPVSSDDTDGLRIVRERAPAPMDVATGEYGYDPEDFLRWLRGRCCDVLQPDATRCQGVTGFLHAASLAGAFHVPVSAHTAPTLHAHLGCAVPGLRHLEWFHDHVRVERMLFDGWLEPRGGALRPDRSRPGLGIELRREDAARYRVGDGAGGDGSPS